MYISANIRFSDDFFSANTAIHGLNRDPDVIPLLNMSKDMPWRPTLSNNPSSSRLSAVKGYISQRDFKSDFKKIPNAVQRGVAADGTKQTWKEWAGQKISAVNTMRGQGNSQNSERIALFPGWAARRYRQDGTGRTQGQWVRVGLGLTTQVWSM